MKAPTLSVVTGFPPTRAYSQEEIAQAQPGLKTETVAERVRRLQDEARSLAKDHVRELVQAMMNVEQMAAEIAEGGDAYPPGVRDLGRRFVEDCKSRVQTLEAISARA